MGHQIPEIIFFDTSSLRRLAGGLGNVDFLELRKITDLIKLNLVVPEVVVMEWVRFKQDEMERHIKQIQSSTGFLHNMLGNFHKVEIPPDALEKAEKKVRDDLSNAGFTIAGTPEVELKKLIKMAVDKTPPFEEKGEKGFRDSIILETITSEMLKHHMDRVAFVTTDNIFCLPEIKTGFDDRGLSLQIYQEIKLLNKFLLSELTELGKQLDQKNNEAILHFLNNNFSQIKDYLLANAEVSTVFLTGFGPEKTFHGTIRKILKITPVRVVKVSTGDMLSKKVFEGERKMITFSTEVNFHVLMNEFGLSSLFYKKFSFANPQSFENAKYPEPRLEERNISREIDIEASILETPEGAIDLKLNRIISF